MFQLECIIIRILKFVLHHNRVNHFSFKKLPFDPLERNYLEQASVLIENLYFFLSTSSFLVVEGT